MGSEPSRAAPRLVVVIPHHSRADLLPATLAATAAWRRLVVDDGPAGRPSPDLGPDVELLRTDGELGFARAVNLGLAQAQATGAERVLLLNDDAVPAPGCVEALLDAFQPGVGAVGPVLWGPDGAVESAGLDHRWWGRVRFRRTVPAATTAVGALSGACLLVDSATRLDPAYPHGFEDLALCRSLRDAGRLCLVVPHARCDHLGGGTLSRVSRAAQRHGVHGHLRLEGGGWRGAVVVGLATAQILREGGPPERFVGLAQGLRDWVVEARRG
ncbi:MAG: glycosyltransferase family 2 protein [Alphaproteobacteria bacterium]|nr:glycosyltransferase family 2 protein [Alphaproteobacteria bacterium]